ncbi:MAG TPA: sensor histidine kinase, partial [Nocardioides sp.]|nr:sensor histidine kinase [Nocardioides sp.]
MARARRVLVVAAAWAIPIAWIAGALLSGPSDGTTISPPSSMLGADRWGESVTVLRTYGDTPLREGDVISRVDDVPISEWVTDPPDSSRAVGDVVRYEVIRPGAELDQRRVIAVPLTRYPIADAAYQNIVPLALVAMLLAAASVVFWYRPRMPAALAFLASAALVPALLTSWPFGLGAIDLAGSRGIWPQLVGEMVCAIGIGTLLLTALVFVAWPPAAPRRWTVPVAYGVPLAGYAAWVLLVALWLEPAAARLQGLITVAGPALAATAPVALAVLLRGYLRAPTRNDRLAVRLLLLAVVGGLGVRLLLVDIPRRITDEPVVPWEVLALFLAPAVLSCVVVAMLRYRLDEIEPTVRRTLVRAVGAALVGAVFVAVAGAVNLASGTSFESMVAGGVVALVLLPMAVGLNRWIRRLVYGDRASAHQVVAELRRLDLRTAPTDALHETLVLLARRLRLSWAAIEVYGEDDDRIETSIGEPRGSPTVVELVVGGTEVGRLRLEVDPGRDPLGPADRRLLEDVGAQVGALVQAVSMNRDLQRSRQHLISAREEERRRVRRDLHDGLGPSLASLAMRLDAARDLVAQDPERATELLDQLSDQTREEIAEVRRLVDGLRPPALDQLGLLSALRQRADEHNLAARSQRSGPAMSWSVVADDDIGPLPAAVEVAAYRIAIEAVNNAARHSAAESCVVTIERDQEALRVRVEDTGLGLAPEAVPGVGLASMQERAEELGGSCHVTSTAGTGTLIEATL